MTDFKKGGPLQNSNIYATNRLFVKNPLFKKKKKKRAPGVYNPKGKFKYEDGGEQGCPPGQYWDGKKCVDDPFTKGLISQIKKGNESKKPVPSLTRKAPTQPTTNAFTNKPLLNKEIQQKRKRNSDLQKTFPEVEIIGKRPMGTIHGEIPDSFTENLVEFFDQSGYFSWDDASQAYQNWQSSDNMLPSMGQAADMFGAVPVLGKLGKLKYLSYPAGAMKSAYKYFPWQQAVNFFDTAEDIDTDNLNQKKDGGSIVDLTEEEIQKYIDGGYVVEEVNDPSIPKLDRLKPGGAPCPRGQMRDASGKCVPYNWGSGNIQAADSYTGMYGGYDASGTKNLAEIKASAKKGKKFSDYILRGGKTKADEARKLGKGAGQYFGMPGENLEPVNFTKAGLEKYKKEIKDAKKNYEAEEKNRQDFEKALKKKESGKMSTDKFAREYEEKGWADYDPATMKEGYKGQFQDAVDEANARKEANMGVTNTALEFLGGGAGYRVLTDPLGTAKGVAQTIGDVSTLPVGLGEGIYNYATKGDFDMGVNPLTGANYGEGVSETFDALGVIPGIGAAGKLGRMTKAGDLVGDAGKFLTTKTPLKNTAFYKSKNTGTNTSTGLTESDIAAARAEEEAWITSDEYLKRRMANTGETAEQVKKDVDAILKRADKATYNVNANLSGAHGEMSTNLFMNPRVSVSSTAPNPKAVLRHENIHLHSPASKNKSILGTDLHKGWDNPDVANLPASERGVYANYPTIGDAPESLAYSDPDIYNYNMLGYEQQARQLGAMRDIATKNNVNLNAGEKLTEQQVRSHLDDFAKTRKDVDYDYDATWSAEVNKEQLRLADELGTSLDKLRESNPTKYKEVMTLAKDNAAKKITNVLNNAWVTVPTVGAVGTATILANPFQGSNGLQQQKKGGSTDDYIELDIPEEEIQWYINQGYRVEPVTKLKKFIG